MVPTHSPSTHPPQGGRTALSETRLDPVALVEDRPGAATRPRFASAWAYEEDHVPVLYLPWAERLVDAIQLRPGEAVLDVACGTGAVARTAARRVGPHGSVVGLDLDEAMLAVGREVTAELETPIEWHQGDAMTLPFEDGRFDVVFCQQGLQFMAQPHRVLAEMERVLRPGGRLAIATWRRLHHNPAWAIVADALERHLDEEAAASVRAGFAAGAPALMKALVKSAGFQDVVVRIEGRDLRLPCSAELFRRRGDAGPYAERLAALDSTAFRRFIVGLSQDLADHTDDDGVVMPMQNQIVLAGK